MIPHAWRSQVVLVALAMCLTQLAACRASHSTVSPRFAVDSQASPTPIPGTVIRLAILFPQSTDPDVTAIYSQLEAQAFLLKAQRPSLQIVDRALLQALMDEHHLHTSGAVSDETAAHLGHLLGADSILHYRVDRPTWREQMRARFSGQLPPVRVFSKVLRVETGEVLFHHVVSVQPPVLSDEASYTAVEPLVQAAVEQGLNHTLRALQYAFR